MNDLTFYLILLISVANRCNPRLGGQPLGTTFLNGHLGIWILGAASRSTAGNYLRYKNRCLIQIGFAIFYSINRFILQDVSKESGNINDGVTTLSFIRKRNTGDPKVNKNVVWFYFIVMCDYY